LGLREVGRREIDVRLMETKWIDGNLPPHPVLDLSTT
jgi:hypothetical protein